MPKTPMHNRFAEGYLESYSSGDSIDLLSSTVHPARFAEIDAYNLERWARAAQYAAIGTLVIALSRRLVAFVARLAVRLRNWHGRHAPPAVVEGGNASALSCSEAHAYRTAKDKLYV